jgi:hypothetical protein
MCICIIYIAGIDPDNVEHGTYLATLTTDFEEAIQSMIKKAIDNRAKTYLNDPLFEEIMQHIMFCQAKCDIFHGRQDSLQVNHMHGCTHARTYSRMHAQMNARMHACTHVCIHACTHVRIHACTHMSTCTYIVKHYCCRLYMTTCLERVTNPWSYTDRPAVEKHPSSPWQPNRHGSGLMVTWRSSSGAEYGHDL